MRRWIDPEAEASRSGSSVSDDMIGCVDDPERRGRLINRQQGGGGFGFDSQVVLDPVSGFHSVLGEVGVAHVVIGNIPLESGVIDSMKRHGAVVGTPDSKAYENYMKDPMQKKISQKFFF